MTTEQLCYRLFEAVNKTWPFPLGVNEVERIQNAWQIADWFLPIAFDLLAEQVQEDATVECFVLANNPWGRPYLTPRREVLAARAKGLRDSARQARQKRESAPSAAPDEERSKG